MIEIDCFDYCPEEAKAVRENVFINEQDFKTEFDAIDEKASHFVAYLDGKAVGTCRIFEEEAHNGFVLGRLAVIKDARGHHIGKALMEAAESFAAKNNAPEMNLHAQCEGTGFYEALGYESYGPIEYNEHCPHIWMKKSLRGA